MAYHLIIVPHTRWDREGYASFERFRQRLVWAIDDLLDAMEARGGLPCFTLDGQTSPALDYLAARPENWERLLAVIEALSGTGADYDSIVQTPWATRGERV